MATGWGNKTWGASDWGDLSDETVLVSSVATSTSIGTSTASANADVSVSGIFSSFYIESAVAGASAEIFPTGLQINVVTGNEGIGIGVPVSGISSSTNIGTATIDDLGLIGSGWGRANWGDFVWGDNYSVQTGSVSAQTAINSVTIQANSDVEVQGQSLLTSIGNELTEADAKAFPDGISSTFSIGQAQALTIEGIQINTGIGTVDIQAGGNVFVNASENGLQTFIGEAEEIIAVEILVDGLSMSTNIGNESTVANANVDLTGIELTTSIQSVDIDLNTPVDVTGQQLLTSIGNEEAFTDVVVSTTGISATFEVNDVTLISKYEVTGNLIQGSLGIVTIEATADVNVTGIDLTTAIGSPNIIAWAEVDTGTPVTWNEVDLAA